SRGCPHPSSLISRHEMKLLVPFRFCSLVFVCFGLLLPFSPGKKQNPQRVAKGCTLLDPAPTPRLWSPSRPRQQRGSVLINTCVSLPRVWYSCSGPTQLPSLCLLRLSLDSVTAWPGMLSSEL
uniref:Uncharacterized protein n=1 Tax=Melopsittacus undulatus TaxID=13146 RepID=A0A8C6K4R3_MELUD